MIDMEAAKRRVDEHVEYRNRNHNHREGDVLTYSCEYTRGVREGTVKLVVPHYGMNHYVLEVDTGSPTYGTFLVLKSEFQIMEKI